MQSQRLLQKQGVGAKANALQNKFIKKWAAWLIVITFLALFYVWSRVQVVQLGYDITALKNEFEKLSKQVSNIELEIAKLKSPERLEAIAKNELGLRPPTADQIILVK